MTTVLEYVRFVSWIAAHLSLGVVPFAADRWARVRCPRWRFAVTGAGVGIVAAPFSMGLYASFFIPVIGFVPGLVGLVLTLFHGAPGYYLAIALGVIDSAVVVQGVQQVYVEALSGVVWASLYGVVGGYVDWWRRAASNAPLQPTGFAGG